MTHASPTNNAAPLRPKAYSYVRFSTPEQAQGNSFQRQTEKAKAYAERHDLELADLTFNDLGVSAYKSKNARTGALRAFLDMVEDDAVPEGSYLLIENLDRLSRDDIIPAQGLFLSIIGAGINLVTLTDGHVYSTGTHSKAATTRRTERNSGLQANSGLRGRPRCRGSAW